MASVVILLHLVGFLIVLLLVLPRHLVLGHRLFGLGLALTAYLLGVRHAFDADHIAAIDNTTRKLVAEGKTPVSVGLFFSLGHSTVVFLLSALLALGVHAATSFTRGALHNDLGVVGTLISGIFLYLIALLNLGILVGILRLLARKVDPSQLDSLLARRGLVNRLLGRLTGAIRRPSEMYPVGFLFGLGFDTASEVALLILAGGAAAADIPWYAILSLPILFAAGMSLFDSFDGAFMNLAYGWALQHPARRIYYNLTVTSLSVAVAFFIGSVELVGVLAGELGWQHGILAWAANFDLNRAGWVIVGLFVVTWAVAAVLWKLLRIEERLG